MLANNNPYIQEASETIYQLSSDEKIREQCEARNAYYARERHHAKIQKAYEEATVQNQTLVTENHTLTTKNKTLTTENKTLTTENEALKKEIESLKAQLAQK